LWRDVSHRNGDFTPTASRYRQRLYKAARTSGEKAGRPNHPLMRFRSISLSCDERTTKMFRVKRFRLSSVLILINNQLH
jgi:hypothetical protein